MAGNNSFRYACLTLYLALFASFAYGFPTKQTKRQDAGSYDFIIVGGGTAGLALAARLTESGTQSVLVLEAGGSPEAVASYKTPGANLQVLGSPLDWAFTTLPQPSLNNRQITYNRGRCLGGSSAINGFTYGRGSASLYDLWAALGNNGWSWNDIFQYFVKSTSFHAPVADNVTGQGFDASLYGGGPVQIGYPDYTYAFPGNDAFVEAMSAVNVSVVDELNAGVNVGAKLEMFTMDASYRRSSSYDSYYMQSKGRSNLKVLPFSPMQQLILEQEGSTVTATGVVFTDYASGQTFNATANKEVIMSAGAIQTPQLLMLSGIGPAETLAKVGVQLYVGNDNIGKNLQDHTYFSVYAEADSSVSYDPLYSDISKMQAAAAEYQESDGPFIAPIGLSYAFESIPSETLTAIGAGALMNRSEQAHIEYYYNTIYYPNYPTPQYSPMQYNTTYVSITGGLIAPLSKGSVSIQSNAISDPPQIDLQYYSDPVDQAVAIYTFKNLRKILEKYSAISNFTIGPNNGEVAPGPSVMSDDEILNYIRETAVTVWHASGTCAMLPREQGGVVDDQLRVYGVEKLRIVDTSVFPVVPDQHTQGPTYMLAEKAADLIKQTHGF